MTRRSELSFGSVDLRGLDPPRTSALLHAATAGLQGTPFAKLAPWAVAQLQRMLGSAAAVLYDFNETTGTLVLHDAAFGRAPAEPLGPDDPLLLATLAAAGATAHVRVTGARSDLTAPVRSGSVTYGVLTATTTAPAGFAASDSTFIGSLAATLGASRRAERRANDARAVFARSRRVFERSPGPMMMIDAATLRYVDVNQAAIDVYGYSREQWLTMTPYDLRAPEDIADLTSELASLRRTGSGSSDSAHLKADGSVLEAHLSIVTNMTDTGMIYIVIVQDMTERNHALARSRRSEETLARAQLQLEHSALHDRLTGLPNRVLLQQHLEAAIERARSQNRLAAVLFIDVDAFKNVNDTLGHAAGDVLLRALGDRLRANTRQVDCIARMGGDEFVAVLSDVAEAGDAAAIARQLARVVAEPVNLGDRELVATCSIGVAMFPLDGSDAETLLRNADTAMYRAKRDGRATVRFFTPEMHDEARQRTELEERIRTAMHDEDFTLAYQPIYDMGGVLRGSEALIRWTLPGGTAVQPNEFIPYAEESGLIIPIGAWVLRTACAQNAAWNRSGRATAVSVNVSGKQIADPHFVRTVQHALYESGLAPELLELELTETVMSSNVARNVAVVKELRALGVRIAIDDFGIGFNSLATLRAYAVDTLKLDMCFVSDIAANPVDRAIAAGVITAAHGLGARVVAEGIETREQLDTLAALDCDCGQGYLFAKPVSAEAYEGLLSANRTVAA